MPDRGPSDCDASLYDGFLPDSDRLRFPDVRGTPPAQLASANFRFNDPRLPELLFRYRARNWGGTLAADERERWTRYRRERLAGTACSEYSFATYFDELRMLRTQHAGDARVHAMLDELDSWGRGLEAQVG
jgi:exodeoxyribonuclease-1